MYEKVDMPYHMDDGVGSVKGPLPTLSAYGFFTMPIHEQVPVAGVVPYRLNTPLFSDHALKLRFVRIPAGSQVMYNDTAVFDFPLGTALVKTFYFPEDMRDPGGSRRLVETRVLIREAQGWKAYPYIWNAEQSDAFLDVAGGKQDISFIDAEGRKRQQAYLVPNLNQCKGCHNKGGQLLPIGPTAWQLNGLATYPDRKENQLLYWKMYLGLNLPEGHIPKGVVWNDPTTGSLNERARIWLDIQCAHCHRIDGPASTSGLYLSWSEQDSVRLGFSKTPVAAGRGSGHLRFDIVPGKPEESILLHRIRSVDPGVMMPELGRTQADAQGVELIRAWIASMKP